MTCPRPHSSDEAAASQGGGTEGEPSATGVRMDLNPGFCVLAQGSTQQQAWLLESPIPSKQGIYPGKFPKVGPCTASVYEKVPGEAPSFTWCDHCLAEAPLGVGTRGYAELEGMACQNGRGGWVNDASPTKMSGS